MKLRGKKKKKEIVHPEITEHERVSRENAMREMSIKWKKQEEERIAKLKKNVRLKHGELYHHFRDDWCCLIIDVYFDDRWRQMMVKVWIFENNEYKEQIKPEYEFRRFLDSICPTYT